MRLRFSLFTTGARLSRAVIPAAALLAVCRIAAPELFSLVTDKIFLFLLGALGGYAADVAVFPYAAPDSYLKDDWRDTPDAEGGEDQADFPIAIGYEREFLSASFRRAAFVLIGMLVLGLGR